MSTNTQPLTGLERMIAIGVYNIQPLTGLGRIIGIGVYNIQPLTGLERMIAIGVYKHSTSFHKRPMPTESGLAAEDS